MRLSRPLKSRRPQCSQRGKTSESTSRDEGTREKMERVTQEEELSCSICILSNMKEKQETTKRGISVRGNGN